MYLLVTHLRRISMGDVLKSIHVPSTLAVIKDRLVVSLPSGPVSEKHEMERMLQLIAISWKWISQKFGLHQMSSIVRTLDTFIAIVGRPGPASTSFPAAFLA